MTLALALQFQDFFNSDHAWSRAIPASTKQAIARATCGQARSESSCERTAQASSESSCGQTAQASSKELLIWLPEWATDRSQLKWDLYWLLNILLNQAFDSISSLNCGSTTSLSYVDPQTSPTDTHEQSSFNMSNEEVFSSEQNSSFFTAQWQELNNIIRQAIAAALIANQLVSSWGGSNGNNRLNSSDNGNNTGPTVSVPSVSTSSHWKADEVGLFDPHLDKSHEEGEVVTVSKEIYYWSVMLFIEWIQDIATIKGAQLVWINLNTCLCGGALAWYTSELSNLERVGLRSDENGVEEWCRALKGQFKESTSVTLSNLTITKYTMADAQSHCEPAAYVQSILQHARSANIDSVENQLTFAYQNIATELRAFIDPPTSTITVSHFIQTLEMKKDTWWNLQRDWDSHIWAANPRNDCNNWGLWFGSNLRYDNQNGQYNNFCLNNNFSSQFSSQFLSRQAPFPSLNQPGQVTYQASFPPHQFGQNQDSNLQQWNPVASQQQPGYGCPPLQPTIGNAPYCGPLNQYCTGQSSYGQQNKGTNWPNGSYGANYTLQPNYPWQARAYHGDTVASEYSDKMSNQYNGDFDTYEDDYYANNRYEQEDSWANYTIEGNPNSHSTLDKSANGANNNVDTNHAVAAAYNCRHCRKAFESNNALHRHVQSIHSCTKQAALLTAAVPPPITNQVDYSELHQESPLSSHSELKSSPVKGAYLTELNKQLVHSNATNISANGYGFQGWRYATVDTRFSQTEPLASICLDTSCTASLVDRAFLANHALNAPVRHMISPMKVCGLSSTSHSVNEYVQLDIYLPSHGRTAIIRREIHIVDSLKANMLVSTDILVPEKIDVLLSQQKAVIGSCQSMEIPVHVITLSDHTNQTIQSNDETVIPAYGYTTVPIETLDLPTDWDLLFESDCNSAEAYTFIVNHILNRIQLCNDTNKAVVIPRHTQLGCIVEYEADGCFLASQDLLTIANPLIKLNWVKQTFWALLAATAVHHVAMDKLCKECVTDRRVTIYGKPTTIEWINAVVSCYLKLWEDHGHVVNVSEEEWMDISLLDNWKDLYKVGQSKIYSLRLKDCEVVDEAFNKLHDQGWMNWTSHSTPFTYLCFVVWKSTLTGRKRRVVVDIQALNWITMSDAYSVPSQADILAAVQGASYISTVDCSSFFYQWRVKSQDCHKLTVTSHCGQETFKVAIMSYWNAPAYVQRMIDCLLQPHWSFSRVYVDNIVVFTKFPQLEEHLKHLNTVFQMLDKVRICLSLNKSFLDYPTVQLLGQWVNALGLATAEDKLAAITNLEFPQMLRQLETYLGMTGYLQQYVPHYAVIVKPLQARKNALSWSCSSIEDNACKSFARTTIVDLLTSSELDIFYHLQTMFLRPTNLTHYNPSRQLYIDMNAFKEFGFSTHIYHMKNSDRSSIQKSMESILFLSKALSDAETRYWPTELEVAGLVWVVQKVRHMIESGKMPTIVYTDHSTTLSIAKQSSLTTTISIDRMNLWLVHASEFLQQFRLDIHHKTGKMNIIPDALSCLASQSYCSSASVGDLSLNALMAEALTYAASLVEMSDTFRQCLIKAYQADPRWKHIRAIIEDNKALDENAAKLPYWLTKDLIYFDNVKWGACLCIPHELVKEVFQLTHDELDHTGYACTHKCLSQGLYIYNMTTHLHKYIRACPQCQLNQTSRHALYGLMQPILAPLQPFHTVALDFILILSVLSPPDCFNSMMSVTDKFSKAVTFVPGKKMWGDKEWATVLLLQLDLISWGLPSVIISDRDVRFVGGLWKTIFEHLKVDLFYSTAYHSQTDSASEATNQKAEIALRYYLMMLNNLADWPSVLPRLQAAANNAYKASIQQSVNEVLYGFKSSKAIDLLQEQPSTTIITAPAIEAHPVEVTPENEQSTSAEWQSNQRTELQITCQRDLLATMSSYRPSLIDAQDTIAWTAMQAKYYYNQNWQPQFFKVSDSVNLQLHCGYSIPSITAQKVQQQFVEPFQITEWIGWLVYWLDLPSHWKIHDVISIAHLELATTANDDLYQRPRPDHPSAVTVDDDADHYEIERLLQKQVTKWGCGYTTEFLIRWKGYGAEHNVWYNLKNLAHARELVDEYKHTASQDQAMVLP